MNSGSGKDQVADCMAESGADPTKERLLSSVIPYSRSRESLQCQVLAILPLAFERIRRNKNSGYIALVPLSTL